MMVNKKHYTEMGIEVEARKYEESYDDALLSRDCMAQKVIVGEYKELIKNARISFGEDSDIVGELEAGLKKMEAKE